MNSDRTLKVVILAGYRDFGRCRLAGRVPMALWPVAGRPVLQRLLDCLAAQGVAKVIVCSNGEDSLMARSIRVPSGIKVQFLAEPLPAGTAGCIRDAAGGDRDTLFLVFATSIVSPPKIDILLHAHYKGRSDLTVMFNPDDSDDRAGACVRGC